MMIKLNIDRTPHKEKPTGAEIAYIRNRLAKGSAEINTAELTAIIESGGSFTPALMDSGSGESWRSQQIIVVDIDNDEDLRDENGNKVKDETGHVVKVPIKNPLSSERAMALCAAAGITPFCIYHTFSNGKDYNGVKLEKYRIVLVLEEPLTNKEEAVNITDRFTNIFNAMAPGAADTTMADAARLIFGSYKGSITNNSGSITPLEVMRALPEIQPEKAPAPRQEPAKYEPKSRAFGWNDEVEEQPPRPSKYDDIKAQRRYDIETFDLYDYVMQTERPAPRERRSGNTTFLNPCPICGHNNDFTITGHLWRCFGSSGDKGGTIIDYIMARENKTQQEALKKFDSMMNYEEPQPVTVSADPAPEEPQTEETAAEKLARYNGLRANNLLADFIESNALDTPCIKTGFEVFDAEMDGGLYPGLYILGAISSMGKTSFMLQLADQISAEKYDVLYFTLEMGAHELIAKSLSRYTYIEANKNADNSVYTRTITNVKKRAEMTMQQRVNYDKALDEYYLNVSNNLWYFESIGDIGIKEIAARIKTHVEITGRVPLLFIDYLQIMKPINETWTEKRNTDKAVLELRKLAREYNTTIFIISSLNRSSYKGDISMDAFKESGAIEYGSDVLLGLQPRGMAAGSYKKDEKNNIELVEDTKSREIRELELKVLKNRTGRTGQRINFEYNAKFNYFEEEPAAPLSWQEKHLNGVSNWQEVNDILF